MNKTISILMTFVISIVVTTIALFILFFQLYPIKYTDYIKSVSIKFAIPPSLVTSVINCESHFNETATSSVGAVGLMQLLPTTAKFIAQKNDIEYASLTNPENNITLGTAYIKYLIEKFPDQYTMLCAYNAGEGNVTRWLSDKRYSIDGKKLFSTPFPATNYYAAKVLHDEKIYRKFFG